jgi:hypothetical protein
VAENTLYYGDNLEILRRYVADESVDRTPLRHTSQTFKKAPKAAANAETASLFDAD